MDDNNLTNGVPNRTTARSTGTIKGRVDVAGVTIALIDLEIGL